MKKILVFLVLLVALSSMTFAQGVNSAADIDSVQVQMLDHAQDMTEVQKMAQIQTTDMKETKTQTKERVQAMLKDGSREGMAEAKMMQIRQKLSTGLENALTNVKNENARSHLQANMEKFMNKYKARLDSADDVDLSVDEETGSAKLKVKEQVKYFGLFKGHATKTFDVDAEGKISEHAPWYRFMYGEVSEEDATE